MFYRDLNGKALRSKREVVHEPAFLFTMVTFAAECEPSLARLWPAKRLGAHQRFGKKA